MSDLFPITDADKLLCVERELKLRRSVYPRWTQKGKMTPEQADREIALMEAIVADYRAKVDGGEGQHQP